MAEEPKFKEFKILSQCTFNSDNIKSITTDDTIIAITKDERCEKIATTKDIGMYRIGSVGTGNLIIPVSPFPLSNQIMA